MFFYTCGEINIKKNHYIIDKFRDKYPEFNHTYSDMEREKAKQKTKAKTKSNAPKKYRGH